MERDKPETGRKPSSRPMTSFPADWTSCQELSVSEDEDAPLRFEIVRDGGLVVSYGDTAIIPDVSAMDKAPEGGVSFGKI